MKLKFHEPCINVVEGWNAAPGEIADVKDEAEAQRYIAHGFAEKADGPATASTFDATLNEAQQKADREIAARKAQAEKERAEAPDDAEKAVEADSAKKKGKSK